MTLKSDVKLIYYYIDEVYRNINAPLMSDAQWGDLLYFWQTQKYIFAHSKKSYLNKKKSFLRGETSQKHLLIL